MNRIINNYVIIGKKFYRISQYYNNLIIISETSRQVRARERETRNWSGSSTSFYHSLCLAYDEMGLITDWNTDSPHFIERKNQLNYDSHKAGS